MISTLELYEEALRSGNVEKAENLRKRLLEEVTSEVDKPMIENIRGKKVYENLLKAMAGDLDRDESIKFMCSMITHYVIECKNSDEDLGNTPVSEIYRILGMLINAKDGAEKEVQNFVIKKYKEFI